MGEYFRHEQAIVESKKIGARTRVWAFSHVLPDAIVGEDCNICDGVFIENDVVIGDRVTIKCGVQIWDGVSLEDDVFIGPNVTFTNDPFPRSRCRPDEYSRTSIERGASIGANATILPGISVGMNSLVAAGSVVTRDVPANSVVRGVPARVTGWISSSDSKKTISPMRFSFGTPGSLVVSVPGVTAHLLPEKKDGRGTLSVAERGECMPFDAKRYFLIYDVSEHAVRGGHAHKECHQFLSCIKGECSVMVENSGIREDILLDHPRCALHIRPGVWSVQYRFSSDAVMMVQASDIYRPEDYIREYRNYLSWCSERRP